jgi:hypothetical protein
MKEKPILFSSEMVRAILDGRKNQTRRVIKVQPSEGDLSLMRVLDSTEKDRKDKLFWGDPKNHMRHDRNYFTFPYGKVGDLLWVRESFWQYGVYVYTGGRTATGQLEVEFSPIGKDVVFEEPETKPDGRFIKGYHARPSIFMPRWASRIELRITEIRVERLQDISRGDAMAEGCPFPNIAGGENPISWFSSLWQSINGKESWNANPWVWVIEFEKLQGEKT